MAKVKREDVPAVASKIADLVDSVDTDDRLELFHSVELELRRRAQYFTARCFKATQMFYALPELDMPSERREPRS